MSYPVEAIASNLTSNTSHSLALMNDSLGGWMIAFILYASILILYVGAKNLAGANDTQSLLFAGFVNSVIGIMLFLIQISNNVPKLITWTQLLPILVFTGVMIFMEFSSRE